MGQTQVGDDYLTWWWFDVSFPGATRLLCSTIDKTRKSSILNGGIICADIGIAFSDSTLGTYIHIADPLLGSAYS